MHTCVCICSDAHMCVYICSGTHMYICSDAFISTHFIHIHTFLALSNTYRNSRPEGQIVIPTRHVRQRHSHPTPCAFTCHSEMTCNTKAFSSSCVGISTHMRMPLSYMSFLNDMWTHMRVGWECLCLTCHFWIPTRRVTQGILTWDRTHSYLRTLLHTRDMTHQRGGADSDRGDVRQRVLLTARPLWAGNGAHSCGWCLQGRRLCTHRLQYNVSRCRVCVWEGEREREREGQKERDIEREIITCNTTFLSPPIWGGYNS